MPHPVGSNSASVTAEALSGCTVSSEMIMSDVRRTRHGPKLHLRRSILRSREAGGGDGFRVRHPHQPCRISVPSWQRQSMRAVVYHPKVPAEVRAFLDHYDAISSDLGDSFWQELTEAIDRARDHLERHHFDRTGRRRSNLKRFPIWRTILSSSWRQRRDARTSSLTRSVISKGPSLWGFGQSHQLKHLT